MTATGGVPSPVGLVTPVLTACIGTVGANSLALGPIAPEVARAFDTDTVGVMHAGAAYALGTALGALALSPLVDRLGARRALLGALAALVAAFGDRVIDRLGVRRTLPWAFAAVVLVYVGLGVAAPSAPALVAGAFAWGLANHFGLNLIVAGLSRIDPTRRGAILGAYGATTYLAASVGTIAFGRLYAAAGFVPLAWTAAVTVAIAAVVAALALPRSVRRVSTGRSPRERRTSS